MAAGEAPDAKPNATEDTKAFDGFVSILGAGGFEAAGSGEKDGKVGLVTANGEETDPSRKGR